jgi:hypothetical protein
MHKTISFFALDEPDVSIEVGDRGLYRGKAAITTLFQDQFGAAALKGNLLFPFLTNGAIQIARDGKTAKGTWRSPCVQAVPPKDGKGAPSPIWLFGAYAGMLSERGKADRQWFDITCISQSTLSRRVRNGRSGISTGSGPSRCVVVRGVSDEKATKQSFPKVLSRRRMGQRSILALCWAVAKVGRP